MQRTPGTRTGSTRGRCSVVARINGLPSTSTDELVGELPVLSLPFNDAEQH
jgi:hypothetical protein